MMKIKKAEFKKWLIDACIFEADCISAYPTAAFEHSAEYNSKIKEILSNGSCISFSRARTVKIIIVSAIVISLLLSALACIPLIKKYIIERNESDYSVSVNPDAESNGNEIIRSKIDDVYLPSYVPTGYNELQSTSDEFSVSVIWMKENDVITSDQWGNDSAYSIDAETLYNTVKLAGHTVNYSIKHGYKNMIWEYDGYFFIMTCPDSISFDELEIMIRSISKATNN